MVDASKQFIAKEFKQYTPNIGIIIKNALIKAHYFISMIKHYHRLF